MNILEQTVFNPNVFFYIAILNFYAAGTKHEVYLNATGVFV
jgi:hypothetical protein